MAEIDVKIIQHFVAISIVNTFYHEHQNIESWNISLD